MSSTDFRAARPAAKGAATSARRHLLLAGTAFPLIAASVAYLLVRTPATDTPTSIDLTALVQQQAPAPVDEGPDSVEVTVQRDDTLDQIFRSVGLDIATLSALRARPEVRKALDVLRPGDIITLTHADGVLQSLNRQISNTLTLSVARAGDGYAINYIENPLETTIVGQRARIESSLFEAGQKAGMSSRTIMTLANQIFGWDIDFALDIREGDEFGVLYEQKLQDGRYVSDGRVLAAEFVNQGKTHRAVWFESKDGTGPGLLHARGQGHAQGVPARAARLHAHQLRVQPAPPAPVERPRPRAQGRRLRGADRHADLGGGRRPHRVRRPQGRLRQRGDHRPRARHHDALRAHVALQQVGAQRPQA